MSGLEDVEALLESTAKASPAPTKAESSRPSSDRDERRRGERDGKRDRRDRGSSRDRDHERKRRDRSRTRRDKDGDIDMKSPASDKASRRRSTSRRRGSDHGDSYRGGDFYRGPGRANTHSGSDDDRYYRPGGRGGHRDRDDRRSGDHRRYRDRDDERPRERERDRDRGRGGRGRERRRSASPRRGRSKSATPQLTEDERDRRTVFVQQLAARLRTHQLVEFFEKVGPVKEAQIVKDRVSGRSKGVGYVEFKNEESVQKAIALTGQQLLGIPIIAQLTEAEKNRQARTTEGQGGSTGVPFHRLYVGNIHFSITESDLQNVFEPFGELEFVQLQKEEQGRSRGYGFVQFRNPQEAKEALEKMNGFELAGRPIRVGLGNDKFTNESTQTLLQRFNGQGPAFQGSAFSGHGGRGVQAGGSGGNFDRAGARDTDKGTGGASALDDTDVAGVNFNNYSRDALMRKLARTDEPESNGTDDKRKMKPKTETKPLPVPISQASRCILLKNMFDPAVEEGENWVKDLEDDVKGECEDRYGKVVHVSVDQNSPGHIYLKFSTVRGGEDAIKGLNGRFFGGRVITAEPIVDAVYSSIFVRSRAL